jgi:hypothetical protein
MRLMKQKLGNVMNSDAQEGNFEAFDVLNDMVDNSVLKVNFSESNNMV